MDNTSSLWPTELRKFVSTRRLNGDTYQHKTTKLTWRVGEEELLVCGGMDPNGLQTRKTGPPTRWLLHQQSQRKKWKWSGRCSMLAKLKNLLTSWTSFWRSMTCITPCRWRPRPQDSYEPAEGGRSYRVPLWRLRLMMWNEDGFYSYSTKIN